MALKLSTESIWRCTVVRSSPFLATMELANQPLSQCWQVFFQRQQERQVSSKTTSSTKCRKSDSIWECVHNMMFYLTIWHLKNILISSMTSRVVIQQENKKKLGTSFVMSASVQTEEKLPVHFQEVIEGNYLFQLHSAVIQSLFCSMNQQLVWI